MTSSLEDFHFMDAFSNSVNQLFGYLIDHLNEILFALLILLIAWLAATFVDIQFKRSSQKMERIVRLDITKFIMLRHISVGFIYIIGFAIIFYSIPGLRALSSTILVSVSIAGIIIGIAAQDTVGNIISGIALTFFHPFRVGDLITTNSIYGRVTDINLRQTTIITFDNRMILIPNSVLNKETITNWTFHDPVIRWSITLLVSFNSDIRRARQVIIEEIKKSPYVLTLNELNINHPELSEVIRVRVSNFNTYGIDLLIDYWINDRGNAYSAEYAIRESIVERINKEPDIHIPLPRYVLTKDSAVLGKNLHNEPFQKEFTENEI